MPDGSTNGSKLMSRALPGPSVATEVRVSVPASMTRRSGGHGMVASFTGSDGAPRVSINRHCSGPDLSWRTTSSNNQFGPGEAGAGGDACCSGPSDQRTAVRAPDSLTNQKALSPRKVLSPNPDVGGCALM